VARDGGDDADGSGSFPDPVIAGRSAEILLLHGIEAVTSLQFFQDLLARNGKAATAVRAMDGHVFDEADPERSVDRERREPVDLVVVYSPHHHHVDLDVGEAALLRLRDSFEDATHVAASGDPGKPFRPDRIEAYVQAFDAGLSQFTRHLRQEMAVGGEDQLFQSREPREPGEEPDDPLAHERLPARDTNLLDPEAHRRRGNEEKRIVGEDLPASRAFSDSLRPAVAAPKVASAGD
jgi:hypothetical protein